MNSKEISNVSGRAVVSKARISQFVHDAAEMEKREYILRGVAVKLSSQERAIRSLADNDVRDQQEICRKFREELNAEEAKLNAAKQELAKAEEARDRLFARKENKNLVSDNAAFDEYGNRLPEEPEGREEYEECKKKLEKYKKYDKKYTEEKYFSIGGIIWRVISSIPIAAVISYILMSFLFSGLAVMEEIYGAEVMEADSTIMLVVSLAVVLIILSLAIPVALRLIKYFRWIKITKMRNFVRKYDAAYAQYERELALPAKKREEAQKEFDKCNAEVNKYLASVEEIKGNLLYNENGLRQDEEWRVRKYKEADWVHAQFVKTEEAIKIIHARKLQLYEIGIVPPDYRTLDATLMIANIFDNDLADTMREAVLLYDERVHRGEVVRGLDNISRSLDRLNNTMGVVVNCLNDINKNINRVVLEINGVGNQIHSMNVDMVQGQKMAAKDRERALEEATALRYATEAVRESGEKVAWYIEQQRMGNV